MTRKTFAEIKIEHATRQQAIRDEHAASKLAIKERFGNKKGVTGSESQLICPHCQVKGSVHTKQVKVKKGISTAKATGAVVTFGLTTLVTGLAKKGKVTQATCSNCTMTWQIG